jgi:hypothetical protein
MRRGGLSAPLGLAVVTLGALCASAGAQSRDWVWMSGSSALACTTIDGSGTYCQQPGSCGTLGVAAAANAPSGRSNAASWIDSSGNLWLFGGENYDPALLEDGSYQIYNNGYLDDLWEYSPKTQQWTWAGGGSGENQSGVYGTLGVAAGSNFPGARWGAASWTDGSGNFWLFGGEGYDANYGESGFLNDLWRYNPTSGQWAWMGGSSALGSATTTCRPGVYGTLGNAAAGNIPGGRAGAAVWTDASGNRWLLGGMGCDAAGNFGALNDLWQFNAATQSWVWMSGSSTLTAEDASGDYGRNGEYGALGLAAQNNVPGGRYGGATWTDASGNLWLFGGQGYDSAGTLGFLNDLWEFSPLSQQWTWMGGSNTVPLATGGVGGQPGIYGALGVGAASNVPGGRSGAANWSDSNGNFWLLGGGGRDSNGSYGGLNDLWELNPSTRMWTWVAGGETVAQPGAYGTLGVTSSASAPGGRSAASSWSDTSGNIWIFGGQGYDVSQSFGMLNDLWLEGTTTPAPSFIPPPGSYTGTEYVSISDAEAGATLYYTTDGTPPTENSTPYTGPVKLTWSVETLQAIAVAPGLLPSTASVAAYALNGPTSTAAATPVFSPSGGAFAATQTVSISDATAGAAIYYTVDESTPTASSTLYTGSISVASSTTLKAIAVAAGYLNSALASATYTIVPTTTTLTVTGSDPYNMTCAVSVPALQGVTGPTGKVTFTDATTGQTLGTAALGAATMTRGFQATAAYKVGNVPSGIAYGDFNGDGKLDLAITNNADATVSILLNNGDGTFKPQATYAVSKGPLGVSVGDLNGDGKLDLAVANGSNGSISVLLGNGDGTFQTQKVYADTGAPTGIAVGDFNGDGKLDIAVTNPIYNQMSVLLGNGDGSLQTRAIYSVGSNPRSIVAGHFGGTGQPLDLVVANEYDSTLSFFQGKGDGTFQQQSVISSEVGTYPISMVAADFNGDGNLDLAITSKNLVTVLLGNGDGTFQYSPALTLPVSPVNPVSIASGDFNGDGIPDLAVTDANSASALILTGKGDGTFQMGSSYPVGSGASGLVAADLNGDGSLDLATANAKGDTVSVLLSFQSAFTSPSLANVSVNIGTSTTHNLRCSYSGDANYPTSTSNTVAESYSRVFIPVFSLLTGDYPAAQQVSISDANAGAQIYYTSDGSTPTTSSTKYTGPFTVSSAVKLKAMASLSGYAQSTVSEATYDIAATPSFTSSSNAMRPVILASSKAIRLRVQSPRGEETPAISSAPQMVTIADATPGAIVYYTTDGTTPSTNSATYSAPILVTKSTTIQAFATAPGYVNSPVTSATYTVAQASTAAVTLATSASTISYGTSITLSATVTGSGGTPTGTVAFLDGGTQLGASAVSAAGAATVTVNALSGGTHSILASYAGDSNFTAASSSAVPVTVNPAGQTIAFAPLETTITYGANPLRLKANASSGLAVSFAATGPATISDGNLVFVGAGTVAVTAIQSGNGNYSAATPATQTITVNQATPAAVLKVSSNSGLFGSGLLGSAVTLAVTVTGAGAIPSGTVTFYSGTSALATAKLDAGGAAIYTTSKLGVGNRSITASYGGDANYKSTVSAALTVTVSRIGHIKLPFRFGGVL